MSKACALSGHRDLPLGFDCKKLKQRLANLYDEGCDRFFVGMARGFDLAAAAVLTELKRQGAALHITACIPFAGQSGGFSSQDKKLYGYCLKNCDDSIVFYQTYTAGCMHQRNRYMVDNSDMLLAYLNKDSGGTYYTVEYAAKKNKRIELF